MHNRLYQAITRCSRLISIFFFIFFLTATQVLAELDSTKKNPEKASGSVVSQPEFKSMYAPHNKLKVPDDKTVNRFKDMDMIALPVALDMLIENISLGQEVKNILVKLLTSLPREKIGDALGKMSEPNQILCINMLSDEYALDLIYYIPEAAYNRIADKLNALKVDKYSKKGATSSSVSPDQSPQLANQYWNQAQAAVKNGRYHEAAQLYEKSAEAEKKTTIRGLQIYLKN